jgi:hypothetical protein
MNYKKDDGYDTDDNIKPDMGYATEDSDDSDDDEVAHVPDEIVKVQTQNVTYKGKYGEKHGLCFPNGVILSEGRYHKTLREWLESFGMSLEARREEVTPWYKPCKARKPKP